MLQLMLSPNGLVAIAGAIAFVVFVAPWTPLWLAFLALGLFGLSLARVIVVGSRRHKELTSSIDIDVDDDTEEGRLKRQRQLVDLINRDRQ